MSYLDVLNAYKSQLGPFEAEQAEQQSRLEKALGTLTARAGGEYTIPRQAEKAFKERDVQMASLKGQQRERQEALGTARTDIRAEHTKQPGEAGYVNHYRVEALIRASEEGRRREISSYGDVIQQRHGTQQEAIGDVLAAYQAGTARAQAEVTGRQAMLDYSTQRLGAETNLVQQAYGQGYREEQDKIANELARLAAETGQSNWERAQGFQEQQWETEWPVTEAYQRALTQRALRPPAGPSGPTRGEQDVGANVLADYARQLQQFTQDSPSALANIWGIGPSSKSYEDIATKLRMDLASQYPSGLGEFEKYIEMYRPKEQTETETDRSGSPYSDW